MKLDEIKLLCESPFTPRNFPAEPNKRFSGAGERTVYSELPVNQPGGEGFRIMRKTKVVRGKGDITEVPANSRIFWTFPGKLFLANEVGEKGSSNYALFGFQSANPKDAVGFIPISAVEKPSQVHRRVLTGKAGQEAVLHYIQQTFVEVFTSIRQVHSAGVGSTKPDLIVSFDGTIAQFEIKNSSSPTAPVTLFDKTVRRDKSNVLIDELVAIMTGKEHMTLARAIDLAHKKDKTIGFPGDKGVGKSGKYAIRIDDTNDLMEPAYDFLLEHFAENRDNYLAINTNDRVTLYFTDYGENILKTPRLPIPKYIDLRTYGGPTAGGMRMGVKVKF